MGFHKIRRKVVLEGGSAVYGLKVYSQNLTPAYLVGASGFASPETFTITGLSTDDKVLAVIPPHAPDTASPVTMGGFRVSAANTLEITFVSTGGGGNATPMCGTYKVVVLRAVSGDEV